MNMTDAVAFHFDKHLDDEWMLRIEVEVGNLNTVHKYSYSVLIRI